MITRLTLRYQNFLLNQTEINNIAESINQNLFLV